MSEGSLSMGRCDLTAHMGRDAEGGLSVCCWVWRVAGRPAAEKTGYAMIEPGRRYGAPSA
jgi:hypothetical protein